MAQLIHSLRIGSSFEQAVYDITDRTISKSMSATLEESVDMTVDGVKIAIRTVERYSAMGGNRVGMNIVFSQGQDGILHVAATSAGGGSGLIKFVGWGEEEFLGTLERALAEYR